MLVRYTVDEVRGLVSDAKARLVVTDEGTLGKAVAACQGLQVDFMVKDLLGMMVMMVVLAITQG